MGRNKKKKRDGDNRRPRLVLSFDEEKRREYLTGFHKRKVERKKAAIEERLTLLQESASCLKVWPFQADPSGVRLVLGKAAIPPPSFQFFEFGFRAGENQPCSSLVPAY
ncbi:hypothetical protein HJG60_010061 [Phyllostomus discolor]|uniref:Nucleolar protein 12 n=1 Tax=Phyllostomus discolor TaxID=89673 RepID=A0A834AW20_9CHIR|nr:hypothetical protein HJG60_010061 [Phyllostomus discolor]